MSRLHSYPPYSLSLCEVAISREGTPRAISVVSAMLACLTHRQTSQMTSGANVRKAECCCLHWNDSVTSEGGTIL
jgi:hypothetical protein